jgi:hypothetical protein
MTMEAKPQQKDFIDPFVNAIINYIPPEIQKTIAPFQWQAFIDALSKACGIC